MGVFMKIIFSAFLLACGLFSSFSFALTFQETHDRDSLKRFIRLVVNTETEARESLDHRAAGEWFKGVIRAQFPERKDLMPTVDCTVNTHTHSEPFPESTSGDSNGRRARMVTLVSNVIFMATIPDEIKDGKGQKEGVPHHSQKAQIIRTVIWGVVELGKILLSLKRLL